MGTFDRLAAGTLGSPAVRGSGYLVSNFGPGVTVSAGAGPFVSVGIISAGTDFYLGVRFQDFGTKFGWVHVIGEGPGILALDIWTYNVLGGSVITLSESVTTSRLALTDGTEKLHWTNDNEDGVARYEVQSKDASGNWQTADSDVPGNGTYSAKVAAGATSRLVVEMTDGSTKEIDF